jgi:hypothetical protein
MSGMPSETGMRGYPYPGEERRWRSDLAGRRESGGPSNALLIAGVALVGLGILTWYYLGPDFVRYMKIRDM